jgi:hypothetical protein
MSIFDGECFGVDHVLVIFDHLFASFVDRLQVLSSNFALCGRLFEANHNIHDSLNRCLHFDSLVHLLVNVRLQLESQVRIPHDH